MTLDTNTVHRADEINAAIAGRAVELATTTVTHREKPGSEPVGAAVNEAGVYGESVYDSGAVYAAAVYETWVLGESALGCCVLGGDESPSAFESILKIISNGSFPPSGGREDLMAGERRQLRDR